MRRAMVGLLLLVLMGTEGLRAQAPFSPLPPSAPAPLSGPVTGLPPLAITPRVPFAPAASPPVDLAGSDPVTVPGSWEIGATPPRGDHSAWTHEASAYPYIMWGRAEYLAWWVNNGPAPPPLVTTGPAGAAHPAVLGQPGTVVLVGAAPLDYHGFAGGRWTVGSWCAASAWGIEVSGLALENRTRFFTANSDGSGGPVIGRPFTDAQTGQQQVLFAAFPGLFAGGVTVSSQSHFWGLEVNLLDSVLHGGVPLPVHQLPFGEWRLELQAGLRYLDLHEDLAIDQATNLLAGGVASFLNTTIVAPNALVLRDDFDTRNQFYGGQVGTRLEWVRGCLFVDALAKIAVGATHEVVNVNGSTTLVPPSAAAVTARGGLLATSTNSGGHDRERWAVLPELGLTVGYQCGSYVRVLGGYSLLYWSRVVRPGNEIDRTVNLTQVPIAPTPPGFGPLVGPARPAFAFREIDFWAQGLSFGLEIRF